MKRYKKVLLISDLHIPYHHPESFDFLQALKKEYKPDFILCGGDETDAHALSMHSHDPDLDSAGKELVEAKKHIKELLNILIIIIIDIELYNISDNISITTAKFIREENFKIIKNLKNTSTITNKSFIDILKIYIKDFINKDILMLLKTLKNNYEYFNQNNDIIPQ